MGWVGEHSHKPNTLRRLKPGKQEGWQMLTEKKPTTKYQSHGQILKLYWFEANGYTSQDLDMALAAKDALKDIERR